MVKQIAQSININYRRDFLKVAVCNHSMKGIMTPFIEHPVHGLLSAKVENENLQQLALSTNETYRLRRSQNSCLKLLYDSSNDQLLL